MKKLISALSMALVLVFTFSTVVLAEGFGFSNDSEQIVLYDHDLQGLFEVILEATSIESVQVLEEFILSGSINFKELVESLNIKFISEFFGRATITCCGAMSLVGIWGKLTTDLNLEAVPV